LIEQDLIKVVGQDWKDESKHTQQCDHTCDEDRDEIGTVQSRCGNRWDDRGWICRVCLDPILTIVHMPFAAGRSNGPIPPLRILDHQLFHRYIELLLRDALGCQLFFERGILRFGSLERIVRHGVFHTSLDLF
jgi:hypothetical protein